MTRHEPGGLNPLNPYLGGSLTGLVVIASVYFTGNFFGASSTFVRLAAMLEQVIMAGRVARMDYFIIYTPSIDWQWMFVFGVFFGSLISSITSGSFRVQAVPDTWRRRFGASGVKRALTAFTGGIIAMFGARLADG